MSTQTITACALVLNRAESYTVYNATTGQWERTEGPTREVGRIEFIAMGEWVLIRVERFPDSHGYGCWDAYTREAAREFYRKHLAGEGWYQGKWERAEASTHLVGEVDLPARRVTYSWGEVAYMYTDVDLPAMRCPVVVDERGKRYSMQPFTLTTPPTPGDPYRHTSNRIQFQDAD